MKKLNNQPVLPAQAKNSTLQKLLSKRQWL